MNTRPKVSHRYVRNAPKKAPCPRCAKLGRRKDTRERTVLDIAYGCVLKVHITTGEYRARCSCCSTFRTQLCIFHILKDLNKCVQDAVRRLRKQLNRRAGRKPKRRGRPCKGRAAYQRRRQTLKEQSAFIFRHRHLFTTRLDHLTKQDRADLQQMIDWLPSLAVLRQFIDQVHKLFEHAQRLEQARYRFQELHRVAAFAADPDLKRALEQLTPAKFEKMITFLRSPLGQRVRTNNHVERLNRKMRHYEKVRYCWRAPQAVVRFIVLAIDRMWQQRRPPTLTTFPPSSADASTVTTDAKEPMTPDLTQFVEEVAA